MMTGLGTRDSELGWRGWARWIADRAQARSHTIYAGLRRRCGSALARDCRHRIAVGAGESRVAAARRRSGLVGIRSRVAARQQGFTLIELLVAMALVALLMTLVYEGLRSGQRAAETGQAFIDRTNRLRITHEFVRQQVSRLMPLAYKQDSSTGKLFMFEGDSEKIRFVAPMPGYLGFGGTYVQELELIRDGRYRSLVFRHWLHNGFDEKKIDDSEKPILLLSGIRDGGFRFKGLNPEGKVGDWGDRWEDPQLTPLAIQLQLEMSPESRIDWPLLEIVMMVDGGSSRSFNTGMLPSG